LGPRGVVGLANPPERLLPWHTASWASLQLLGVIQLKAGVVDSRLRSWASPPLLLKTLVMCLALQSPDCKTDSNQTNGKCLGTYWSVASALPGLGSVVEPTGPGCANGAPQTLTPALCGAVPAGSGLPRSWA